ncbi:general substrate transporter [Ascodesmis nigricans]|uniref:General substrate transporter n=1 Tax=Ascodesmis nigricans TaxID=341454 RepID=A0A4S2MRP9_9PEZI|nr:general substrate transporter [Ascodesmis nigricans]
MSSSIDEKRPVDREVKVVENVAFADAMAKAKPNPFHPRLLVLYCLCLVGTLNSCINGYDGSLMSSINAMEQYQDRFGMEPTGGRTGFVFAIYTIGNIVGSFLAGPATDRWGRRWGMFIGALTIIVGTCIQATAENMAQFKGGRFLLGVGVSFSATAGPSYVAEMAHPAYRGTITAIYNSFWFMGSIPASWVTYGTSEAFTDTRAWRIPLWLQMSFSGIILVCAPFIPESPRWLMANDRTEEALSVLTKYHGFDDRNNPFVELSYREMKDEITTTGSDKRWWDYSELVNSRSARYRLMMVVSMAFFGQWSGNAAISYFMPVMVQQAGIDDRQTQLMLNGIIAVVSFIGALIGSSIVDRAGRRPMLFTASCLFVLWFVIITALSATFNGSDNKAGSNATIAMIYLFGFTFSIAFTPFQALYPVECLKFETRAKGMATYNFWVNIASFFNQYVTPIGLGDVKWKFYFMYIAWDAFQAIFIFLFYVETKNRTLEELNEIFEAKNPKKASLAKAKVELARGDWECT